MLVLSKPKKVGSLDYLAEDERVPRLITEGSQELNILCPVSKLTGFPISMQAAIFMITDSNSRIAEMLYEEIPYVQSSNAISDSDKLKLLVSRLDSGSFFENDKAAEILGDIAKTFFPQADVDSVVKEASIQFNKEADAGVSDAQ